MCRWWNGEWAFSQTGYWIALFHGKYRLLFVLFIQYWMRDYIWSDSCFFFSLPEEYFQLLQACTVKATKHQILDEETAFQILENSRKAYAHRVKFVGQSCFVLFFFLFHFVCSGWSSSSRAPSSSTRIIKDDHRLFPGAWICFVYCVQDNDL